MNKYDEQAQKLKDHLQNHSKDYQSLISFFKVESDSIVYEEKKNKSLMMREIAKYKRDGEINGK